MSTLISSGDKFSVHHCHWRRLVEQINPLPDQRVSFIFDAPYSAKTHNGHNAEAGHDESGALIHRAINYEPWGYNDVLGFVFAIAPICTGWMVSITDDVLAPMYIDAMERVGRYAFAPLPFVEQGGRIRRTGDGPSNWTNWIVVSRPAALVKWRTLPGAYVLPKGQMHRKPIVGGKVIWIMERLIEDYTNIDHLVVDPCSGAGTTGAAALRMGRSTILGDQCKEHAEMSASWCRNPHLPPPGIEIPHTIPHVGYGQGRLL